MTHVAPFGDELAHAGQCALPLLRAHTSISATQVETANAMNRRAAAFFLAPEPCTHVCRMARLSQRAGVTTPPARAGACAARPLPFLPREQPPLMAGSKSCKGGRRASLTRDHFKPDARGRVGESTPKSSPPTRQPISAPPLSLCRLKCTALCQSVGVFLLNRYLMLLQ